MQACVAGDAQVIQRNARAALEVFAGRNWSVMEAPLVLLSSKVTRLHEEVEPDGLCQTPSHTCPLCSKARNKVSPLTGWVMYQKEGSGSIAPVQVDAG